MISSYQDLVQASQQEPEGQRFLFVFCKAELPDDASASERETFNRGEGGALTPVICVDKTPNEAPDFNALAEESRATGQDWDMVFVAAMSGRGGIELSSDEAQQPLTMMVESIRMGNLGNYLPLDQSGQVVNFG
ncbi:ribonucleotide reductase subunit alpha [Marinobacter sp.]|uniref:ribonucleotide reductase subunit alpha n=1 Tax=Marinobacter sp. TaxID=50741 RepID=UPI001A06C8EB|nr:ribonucleotide reductase subunit alpha [Marinobacter sp.]MBE0486326.1 ribonucleotide reductase subunit alpha [Marinobacter sp.]